MPRNHTKIIMANLFNNTIFGTHSEDPGAIITTIARQSDPGQFEHIAKHVCNLAKHKEARYSLHDGRLTIEFTYLEKKENGKDHYLFLNFTFEFCLPYSIEDVFSNLECYCSLMKEKNSIEWAKILGKTMLPIKAPNGPSFIDPEKKFIFGPIIPGSLKFKKLDNEYGCIWLDLSFIEFAPGINGATPDVFFYIKKLKNNEPIH